MISELFLNSCILITFLSISHIFIKKKDIKLKLSMPLKVLMGAIAGLLGILLMNYSFRVDNATIADLRSIPIMIAAIYGGFFSSVLASVIIAAYRIFHFGVCFTSMSSVVVILLRGFGFGIISLLKVKRKRKWVYCIIYSIILSLGAILIVTDRSAAMLKTFIIFNMSLSIISFFTYSYIEYIIESVKLYRRYRNESIVDFLTGLNNTRQFNNVFNNIAQRAVEKGEYLSLLFIDIDFFKNVNDTYGHGAGDSALKKVAEILRNTCRDYDIVSRNGGEEFTVILLDCTSARAVEIAEKIRKNVEESKFYISKDIEVSITISIGISTYPNLTGNINELLEDADNALYQAKSKGRNKVVLFNDKAMF